VLVNSLPQEKLLQALLVLPIADAGRRTQLLDALKALPALRPSARRLIDPTAQGTPSAPIVDNQAILPLLFEGELLTAGELEALLCALVPQHAVVVAAVLEENVIQNASRRAFDEAAYFPGRLKAAVAGEVWDEGTLQGVRRYFRENPGSEEKIFFSEGYVRGANEPGVPNKSRIKPKATNLVLSQWVGEALLDAQAGSGAQPLPDTMEILDAEDIPNHLQYLSIAIVFEATQTAVTYLLEHARTDTGQLELNRLRPARLRVEAPALFALARRWAIDLTLPDRLERADRRQRHMLAKWAGLDADCARIQAAYVETYPTGSDFVTSEFEVRSVPAVVQGILELLPWGHLYGKSRHSILEYRQLAKRGLIQLGLPFPLDGTTNSFRLKTLLGLDPRTLEPIPRRWLQERLAALSSPSLSSRARQLLGRLKSLQPLDPHPPDDIIEDAHMGLRSAERGLRIFQMTDPETQTFEEPLPVAPEFYAQRSRWISPQPHGPFWAASLAFLSPLLALVGAGLGGALLGSAATLSTGILATLGGLLLGALTGRVLSPLLTGLGVRLGWIQQAEYLEDRYEQLGFFGVMSVALFQSSYLSAVFAFLGFGVAIVWWLAGLVDVLLTRLPLSALAGLGSLGLLEPLRVLSQGLVAAIPPLAWFVPNPLAGVLVFLVPMLLTVLATLWAVYSAGLDDARLVREALSALEESELELREGKTKGRRAWLGPAGSLALLGAGLRGVRRDERGQYRRSTLLAAARRVSTELHARGLPLLPARVIRQYLQRLSGETLSETTLDSCLESLKHAVQQAVASAEQQRAARLATERERLQAGRLVVGLRGLVGGVVLYSLGLWIWLSFHASSLRVFAAMLLLAGGIMLLGATETGLRGRVCTLGPVAYFRLSHVPLAFSLPVYHLQLIPSMLKTTAQLWSRLDNIWPKTAHGSQATLEREVERLFVRPEGLALPVFDALREGLRRQLTVLPTVHRTPGLRFVVSFLLVPAVTIVGLFAHSVFAQASLQDEISSRIQPLRVLQLDCSSNPLRPLLGELRPALTDAYREVFHSHPELLPDWALDSLALLASPAFEERFRTAHPQLEGDAYWEHLEQHRRSLLTDVFAQVDAYTSLVQEQLRTTPEAQKILAANANHQLRRLDAALKTVGISGTVSGDKTFQEAP
jgi:hypothetical protein